MPADTSASDTWGIAAGFRIARIPYPASDKQVADFIPLLFYENDLFFIRALTTGIKLYNQDQWQFSLIGRYRYFDIPAEFQNQIRGNGLDFGLELKYRVSDALETNFELLSDDEGRMYSNLDGRYYRESGSWELFPYATLRFKSADFNAHYYGLDGFVEPSSPPNTFVNRIGSGYDLTIGSEIRYHVISNLYLVGRAQATTLLDSNTRHSSSIVRPTCGEVYLGVGFFEDRTKPKSASRSLEAKPYIRVAYGWATPSNVGDILFHFDKESDPQDNRMTSIFYGHPVADSLFGNDAFDVYLTTGFVYHHDAEPYSVTLDPGEGINTGTTPMTIVYDSQPTQEYVLAIKVQYNLDWPIRWRPSLSEGLSYEKEITNLEQREMDRKGYRASNLLNYIDFAIDFNLGDLFGAGSMNNLWLGYSLHHRSAIFETSSAFGRIKGGSNYSTVYLQYHW